VSGQVREHLLANHAVSADAAMEIATGAAEQATVELVDQAGRVADVRAFVSHLSGEGRLTASLLLRALRTAT